MIVETACTLLYINIKRKKKKKELSKTKDTRGCLFLWRGGGATVGDSRFEGVSHLYRCNGCFMTPRRLYAR
ncbi:hypothetical protein IscW_ISCW004471 [Ixodes scapularis]|uniref:Uncharacterized protein n=1 Tax=Ixodes scapularis TaxID=6945 RepID=B7PEW2_IXOSC|nr:hypothetical protein IscW_ISCW004471 [Ixodes scapularis]|eukprot:XP_002433734.1 hypothetical protein IscW_ISCW004471 [Ixodes scapularis]